MSDETEKYTPHLDHYLDGVDYHLWLSHRVDKFMVDSVPKESIDSFMESIKYRITGALIEKAKDKIINNCTVTEENNDIVCPVVQYDTDIWLFSKDELENFIMEVKEEVLQGKL